MSKKYNNWNDDITIKNEYFPADRLDRSKYADFLTNMLASQGYVTKGDGELEKRNYVLNLNSEWGSGKTYFLKRWKDSIKGNFPVVYVDAWKQDYSDDPLMTVISSVITQLRSQAGKSEDDPLFKVPRKIIGLLKAAAPGLARGLAKRYLGIDPVAIMKADQNEELMVLDSSTDENIDMGIAASKMVKHLFDEHSSKQIAIDSLKKSVEEWVQAVVSLSSNVSYPAFIFIDELDRCRPSYAVEMLETVKHIFDIEGVVFVIATDTEQLQHTIKSLYGNDFDARSYLGRFFNSRYTLKEPRYSQLLEAHCDIDKLTTEYFNIKGISVWPINGFQCDSKEGLYNLYIMYEAMGLSARQVIQITDRLIATIDHLYKCDTFNIIYLTFLLCLREKLPHIFDSIRNLDITQSLDSSEKSKSAYLELNDKTSWNIDKFYIHLDPPKHLILFL